ncbi:MAG TPA: phosphoadenosine phosphosulfate reductase family protein [Candidatus Enterocloster faecavium]|uniref:Phosphoadenosine phosphosulfate reductase family protein n=1 Tax=Candidatus Enterocloster faecavium TaxID=2838560 RepID=A0A9D2L7I5_9FIRM|nr:phosphoadenosine phosphosulfate reductase family protein [Candidatus Enterocloster faecavium]
MYVLEDDLKLNAWQFSQRKYLDWETKLRLTKTRIREWDQNWDGQVYVSYSGGLDSTVLLHLVRETVGEEVPAVFSNTGLEFPEITQFARKASGAYEEIAPRNRQGERIAMRDVILEEGYPLVSKETACKLRKLRNGNLSRRYRNYLLNGDERGKFGMLPKKWRFLLEAPFEISERCCEVMKKRPFHEYMKRTRRVPYIGITQDEGFRREHLYAKTGCNVYEGKMIKSQPMGFWTKQDVLRYVVEHDLEICSVYGDIRQREDGNYYLTGEQRTGCMFCGFGAHLEQEPNRFQRMALHYPKQYEFCMKPVLQGGLGMAEVLDYMNIPWKWEEKYNPAT